MVVFPALSRISPRVRVWVSVSIVYRIATGGYSWIWPYFPRSAKKLLRRSGVLGHATGAGVAGGVLDYMD